MSRYLLLAFLLFSFHSLSSQELHTISGKVEVDASEDSRINIINLNQKTGTVTSEGGKFIIKVKENDTLLFSSLVYIPKKVTITSKVIEEGFLVVNLEKVVNQLEEVNISDLNLSGNINTDLNSLELIDKFDLGVPISKKPPPTQAQRRAKVNPVSALPGGVAFDFEHLLNVASGRHKKNLLVKKNEDLFFLIKRTREIIGEAIFVEELGLQKKEINGFLYYCAETADFHQHVKSGNKLALLEYFKKLIPEFQSSRKME